MQQAADPYLIPGTLVLQNLIGAQTKSALSAAEVDLTTGRTIQIQDHDPVAHTRDLAEVTALHRHIFQDLFEWAGCLRTINMKRGDGDFFADFRGIETNAHHIFNRLREEAFLHDLDREKFVRRLAHYYDELNFIHPFREGNGRTQRLFWSRVAMDAGWNLNWRLIHGLELDEVSRAAREDRDLRSLENALGRCVSRFDIPLFRIGHNEGSL